MFEYVSVFLNRFVFRSRRLQLSLRNTAIKSNTISTDLRYCSNQYNSSDLPDGFRYKIILTINLW